MRHPAKVRDSRSKRCSDKAIFHFFSKWRQSWIYCVCLDNVQIVVGGIYHCVTSGWTLGNSFDNTQVLLFNDFGLKMPIHGPKIKLLKLSLIS